MRLRSLQADNNDGGANDDMSFERPISEHSQATTSNRGGAPAHDGMQRNTSRRSLLEPLRPGEEIYSPPEPPAASLGARASSGANAMLRPPVPVEPLAPIPEDPPTVGLQTNRIIPVNHVEL